LLETLRAYRIKPLRKVVNEVFFVERSGTSQQKNVIDNRERGIKIINPRLSAVVFPQSTGVGPAEGFFCLHKRYALLLDPGQKNNEYLRYACECVML
jgi:hypothetical protein